jgi:hypothetical protein
MSRRRRSPSTVRDSAGPSSPWCALSRGDIDDAEVSRRKASRRSRASHLGTLRPGRHLPLRNPVVRFSSGWPGRPPSSGTIAGHPTVSTPPFRSTLQPTRAKRSARRPGGRAEVSPMLGAGRPPTVLRIPDPGAEPRALDVGTTLLEQGLPIGMHFIGRYGDEATLYRLAAQWKRRGLVRPPASSLRDHRSSGPRADAPPL